MNGSSIISSKVKLEQPWKWNKLSQHCSMVSNCLRKRNWHLRGETAAWNVILYKGYLRILSDTTIAEILQLVPGMYTFAFAMQRQGMPCFQTVLNSESDALIFILTFAPNTDVGAEKRCRSPQHQRRHGRYLSHNVPSLTGYVSIATHAVISA